MESVDLGIKLESRMIRVKSNIRGGTGNWERQRTGRLERTRSQVLMKVDREGKSG